MKGITTHVMVIIFSLIIMVVLLVIGIGFVQNYTNIPFEQLWDLTPSSGTAKESTYSPIGNGGPPPETPRFFTTSGSYDLSEIACVIGTQIFNDFKLYATTNNRPSDELFPGTSNVWLVGEGSFIYNNTQYSTADYGKTAAGYTTGTNTTVNDSVFGTGQYDGCHICRYPEGAIGNLSSTPPVGGIKDLEENCINMQLKDRNIGTKNFCNDPTGGFYIGTNGPYKFGNQNPWGVDENINRNLISAAGGSTWSTSYCNNGVDRISWYATNNLYNDAWETAEKIDIAIGSVTTDSQPINDESNIKLKDGYSYDYGIFWYKGDGRYYIYFTLKPNENSMQTFSSFNQIPNAGYFNETSGRYSDSRNNILGYYHTEDRTKAIFLVSTTQPTPMSSFNQILSNNIVGYITKVDCTFCKGELEPDDFDPNAQNDQLSSYWDIRLWTNATDDGTPSGNTLDMNKDLPPGHYEVIIRNFMRSIASKEYIDRTVIIYQITCTCGAGVCPPGETWQCNPPCCA